MRSKHCTFEEKASLASHDIFLQDMASLYDLGIGAAQLLETGQLAA